MSNENNPNLTEIIREIHDGVAKEMYCKGVDDFAEKLLSAFDETNIKEYGFYPENLIMQVAKQLKAGEKNERY